ncbi:MAG TPA: helix-turn-helix domain-containing protein [Streptosporangiaceae bacterium]|nr:helix-turn-helix domain-containing protein [Streptosporangiaceae bacterium]
MLLPDEAPDGETYLTNGQAAKVFGVAPSTVSTWVRKGYLARARGRLFRLSDVARAEKLARDAAVRTSGSVKRVIRDAAA